MQTNLKKLIDPSDMYTERATIEEAAKSRIDSLKSRVDRHRTMCVAVVETIDRIYSE